MARKLILDVDTGTDDAVAIMIAALHPALELIGVTTVNGNVVVEHCTDNSLRVLDFIGRGDIPVYEGLNRPLVRADFPIPRAIKKSTGVHGLLTGHTARRQPQTEPIGSGIPDRDLPCRDRGDLYWSLPARSATSPPPSRWIPVSSITFPNWC